MYGQVYYEGTANASAWSAGLSVAGGTITWGNIYKSDTTGGAVSYCATITRMLRLTAQQEITLWAYQGSGASVVTVIGAGSSSKLICVWRAV